MYYGEMQQTPPVEGLTEDELREIIARQLRTGDASRTPMSTEMKRAKMNPMERLAMFRQQRRRPPVNEQSANLRRQAIMATQQGGSM
jgi:hypothetical protein